MPDVKLNDLSPCQYAGALGQSNPDGQGLHGSGLHHTGLAEKDRVVLDLAAKVLSQGEELLPPPDNGTEPSLPGALVSASVKFLPYLVS